MPTTNGENSPKKFTFTLGSPSYMDRAPGTGESVPRIARGFHRETPPEQRAVTPSRQPTSSMSSRVIKRGVSFDGRKRAALQSFETQTDWDWVEDALLDESVKILEGRRKQESQESIVASAANEEAENAEEAAEEEGPLPYPYSNDEYGIPILDLSSDSEDYIRESEQTEMKATEPEENLDASNYPQDEEGNVHGFFSGTCEFCMETILPFPTTEQQQRQSPEELFCCEEYRQFIEVVLAEETQVPSSTLIDIKPHAHYGNKKDRKMAQQKAQLRMRERELLRQRRQSMQSNSQQSSYQTSSRQSRNTNPGLEREQSAKVSKDNKEAKETKEQKETKDPKEGLAANFALFPASQPRRATRHSSALEHFGDRPPAAAYNAFAPVARQMKTINYQLSSQRCLEEGWTVRPPSPMMLDETEDIFIPEPLDPAFAALGKTRKQELIQKYYGDGSPFITIFPDGSGNVFYSSGQVAVVISSQGPGQFTYLVMDDSSEPQVMGVFGSNGHASCCYANRKLRLFLDEYGGIELDRVGAKKRKWFWNDTETHVHAPPFQPVCFALTPHIAVRLMTQENMSLTFRCKARSCKLPVGAKLKLVNPENYPAKEIDADALFINEIRAKTQTILNRISNLLHFPNSPKVEKILPPLHITTRVHKNERMQQQREAAMAAAKAKQEKRRHIRPLVVS